MYVHVDKSRLIKIYSALVRSGLEYSSVTYGPLTTRNDCNRLENVKHCLRNIQGFNKSYEELLEESGLSKIRNSLSSFR